MDKSIDIKPAKRTHFWWYCLGVLLSPVFGIGIYLIYRKWKELDSITYKITDRSIISAEENISEKIDLENIIESTWKQRWIDKKLGIGNVVLKTESRSMELIGMENPKNLSGVILEAAIQSREQNRMKKEKERKFADTSGGSLDRLDYLTGLWQQGLITNAEYEEERKHFED